MSTPILIRNGRVLTMAPNVGEQNLDILIQDDKIVKISKNIEASSAQVIDATDMIVAPGFVDTHRHVWQTQLRTITSDWGLFEYISYIRIIASGFYTADDAYLGNYVGALEAVNAGVTTIIDHSHIMNSPEHADAAARGLQDAGIRGVFCYGTFENAPRVAMNVPADPDWRFEAARHLRHGRLSSDSGLIRFGFAPFEGESMPFERLVEEIRFARTLDAAAISIHVAMGCYDHQVHLVEKLHTAGLLGPDLLFVHGNSLTDHEFDLIKSSGGGIAATPETELQMGLGFPIHHRAHQHGVRVGLGADIVSNNSGDMFMPMRLGLHSVRALRNLDIEKQKKAPRAILPRAIEALRIATIGGAEAVHMESKIGTLEIGKCADVVIVNTDAMHMTPMHDAVVGVALYARPDDVDTVIINGQIVKRNGSLLNADWRNLGKRFKESCERIVEGYRSTDPAPAISAVDQWAIPRA